MKAPTLFPHPPTKRSRDRTHGILLADNVNEEMEKKLNKAVFPGVTSSHHLHEMAALAVTLAEWEFYGEKYAAQVCKNAKALGQAMNELGFDVLCKHKGFTESHTIAVNVGAHGGGDQASKDMAGADAGAGTSSAGGGPETGGAVNRSGLGAELPKVDRGSRRPKRPGWTASGRPRRRTTRSCR